jgi:hypothetical protein
MIGSVSKIMKLSSSFGGGGKKSAQKNSSKTSATESNDDSPKNQRRDVDDDSDGTTRRKKLHIKSDDEATLNDDCFGHDVTGRQESSVSSASSKKMKIVDDVDDAPARKKITIKAPEESVPSIVKSMMSTDDFSSDSSIPDIKEAKQIFENSPDSSEPSAPRKKIRIVADADPKVVQPAAEVLSAIVPNSGLLEHGSVIHADDDSSKNNPFNPGYGVENDNEV